MHIGVSPKNNFDDTIKQLRSLFLKAGASRITIQPHLFDENTNWNICLNNECVEGKKTCCNLIIE